jgi:hypothetical protein
MRPKSNEYDAIKMVIAIDMNMDAIKVNDERALRP